MIKAIAVFFVFVYIDASIALTDSDLREKFRPLQCTPRTGFEKKIRPCYDFTTKKVIGPNECNNEENAHCCLYNCACVLKGAGFKSPGIPKRFALPWSKKKSVIAKGMQLLDGCVPGKKPATTKTTTTTTTTPEPSATNMTAKQDKENRVGQVSGNAIRAKSDSENSTSISETAPSNVTIAFSTTSKSVTERALSTKTATVKSTRKPTAKTARPARRPTPKPSIRPTRRLVRKPTPKRPVKTTPKPVRRPTRKPTIKPTRRSAGKPTPKRPVKTTRKPKRPTRKPTIKPTRRPVRKPTPKRPVKTTRKPVRRPTRKPTTKPTRRPVRKPTPKRPVKTTRKPKRPTRRPTRKPVRKPTPKPPRTTKKPCRSTKAPKTTKPSFSFNFFSQFSRVLNGFGFDTTVVRADGGC